MSKFVFTVIFSTKTLLVAITKIADYILFWNLKGNQWNQQFYSCRSKSYKNCNQGFGEGWFKVNKNIMCMHASLHAFLEDGDLKISFLCSSTALPMQKTTAVLQ